MAPHKNPIYNFFIPYLNYMYTVTYSASNRLTRRSLQPTIFLCSFQPTNLHYNHLNHILILSSYLRQVPGNGLYPSGLLSKTVVHFSHISVCCVTYKTQFLNSSGPIIFSESITYVYLERQKMHSKILFVVVGTLTNCSKRLRLYSLCTFCSVLYVYLNLITPPLPLILLFSCYSSMIIQQIYFELRIMLKNNFVRVSFNAYICFFFGNNCVIFENNKMCVRSQRYVIYDYVHVVAIIYYTCFPDRNLNWLRSPILFWVSKC